MEWIALPKARQASDVSLEQALAGRRSRRHFSAQPIALDSLAQLLWSAQGVTSRRGFRTAPSAGALYPLELYVYARAVASIDSGIYHYEQNRHALRFWRAMERSQALADAAWFQESVRDAAAVLAFAAVPARTEEKYHERALRYVHMEVGHSAQNVCLQAQALGLSSVAVGSFRDDELGRVLALPEDEIPLYLVAVGYAK